MPETKHFDQLSLTVHDLSCVRGDLLLFENLEFEIQNQQCVHIVGENGSGKSSLLKIMAGLLKPDSGHVKITGGHGSSELFSYLAHQSALKNELTAFENLSFYQRMAGPFDHKQIDRLLHRVGILSKADTSVQSLSFGQKRRLAFARLLLQPAPIWLLDEPFTGVDKQGRKIIMAICLEHLQNAGVIVISNHGSLQNGALQAYLTEIALIPDLNTNTGTRHD